MSFNMSSRLSPFTLKWVVDKEPPMEHKLRIVTFFSNPCLSKMAGCTPFSRTAFQSTSFRVWIVKSPVGTSKPFRKYKSPFTVWFVSSVRALRKLWPLIVVSTWRERAVTFPKKIFSPVQNKTNLDICKYSRQFPLTCHDDIIQVTVFNHEITKGDSVDGVNFKNIFGNDALYSNGEY